MNCSVCGGPLLFSRVAFRCSCGAYVHAYCLDKHILLAHRPEFDEGTVDLNGDFHAIEEKVEQPAAVAVAPGETGEEEVPDVTEAVDEEEETGEDAGDEPDEDSGIAGKEPGFVEVDTVPEEEKIDSGDVENNEEEERSSEAGG